MKMTRRKTKYGMWGCMLLLAAALARGKAWIIIIQTYSEKEDIYE
jgi:hypothetical protein